MTTKNEDHPEDGVFDFSLDELIAEKEKIEQELQARANHSENSKLPKINLKELRIKQYGQEEGIKQYNVHSSSEKKIKVNFGEALKRKQAAGRSIDRTLAEYRKDMQGAYVSNEQPEEKMELPVINLDEVAKKLGITLKNKTANKEQSRYEPPEGETERLDEVLGKEQRIAQYGITSKELRSRPVLLEFQTSDGKSEVYSWTAAAEKDYALLEQMSCFEAVGYILARAPLKKTDGKLPDAEGKERLRLEKSLLESDFAITTEDDCMLYPEGRYTIGGKPSADERQRPLMEYLRPGKDNKGRDVWHQRFGVRLHFSLKSIGN